MKLLIIEDEQELSDGIVSFLNREDYLCEQAFSFDEAMMKVGVYDYDCILLDLMLPGGSGLDVLKRIKQQSPQTGVIIVSAKDSLDDKVEGLRLGADDYLAKPFHLPELSMRIFALLRRKCFNNNLLQSGAGTAYTLMGLSVNTLKTTSKVERPDGSTRNSFPSGHTATAFMGAEFLREEYWDVSPWIGISGYVVAAGTGFFRMYNNRHWLTDVLAGAGIGILSTRAAYWLYPTISKTFFRKQYLKNIYISPVLSSQEKGVACLIRF